MFYNNLFILIYLFFNYENTNNIINYLYILFKFFIYEMKSNEDVVVVDGMIQKFESFYQNP